MVLDEEQEFLKKELKLEDEAVKPFNHAEVLKQNPVFKFRSYVEAVAFSKKKSHYGY